MFAECTATTPYTHAERLPQQPTNFDVFLSHLAGNLAELVENIRAIPQKVAFEVSHWGRKPRVYDFNTFLLGERFYEIRAAEPNQEVAMQKFLDLVLIDLRTWISEYVLREDVSTFEFQLSVDEHGNLAITTPEYGKRPLLAMTKEAVRMFTSMGESTSRLQADTIAVAKLMEWGATERDGAVAFSLSPYDTKNKYYKYYSLLFKRTLRVLPDGTRKIETTQFKTWHSHLDLVRILTQLGCALPPELPINGNALTAELFPVKLKVSDEHILQVLQSLPPRKEIPEEFKQVEVRDEEALQKAIKTAESFALRMIREQYEDLRGNSDENAVLRVNRIVEETVGSVKRFLMRHISEDREGKPISEFSEQDLYNVVHTYIQHKYFGQRLSQSEAVSLTASMGGVLGKLGDLASWGSCLGGSFGSMSVKGSSLIESPFKGLSPELLGAKITGSHQENCPFCQKKTTVFDMVDGSAMCSQCRNIKECGAKTHAHTGAQSDARGEAQAEQPQVLEPSSTHHNTVPHAEENPQPAPYQPGDVSSLLAGFLDFRNQPSASAI